MLQRQYQRLRAVRENEGGFTLIELLIVIVILGILAAVVVFAVNGITDRGTTSACQSDVKSVEVAAEAYYAQNGSYPTTITGLVPAFLHTAPNSTKYAITYTGTATSFTVTGKLTGSSTTDCK